MNKTLIVLMAVCLLSVHAFVKRDAEKETKEDLSKQITEFAEKVGDQLKKAFDPETIKKGFNEIVDGVQKTFKPEDKGEAPKN